MYSTQTLEALYRQHIDQQLDERKTIQEAQRLFPYNWRSIFTLMNNTIKHTELKTK